MYASDLEVHDLIMLCGLRVNALSWDGKGYKVISIGEAKQHPPDQVDWTLVFIGEHWDRTSQCSTCAQTFF